MTDPKREQPEKIKISVQVLQTVSGLQDFFARKIVICVRLDS